MSSRSRGRGRSRERTWGDDGWGESGGYMNAKRQKLQDQFTEEAPNQLKKEGSGSKIFNGIKIHVNGYTKPSSDELKRMMMLHGGGYEHYLYRTRVSHVIATNLPDCKIRELKGLKVVKPEWITESIAAGKLLNYADYLLYTAQSGLQQGLQAFAVRQNSNQDDNHSNDSSSMNRYSNEISISNFKETEFINSATDDMSINSNFDHDKFENEITEVNDKMKTADGKGASVSNCSIKSPPSTSKISPAKAGDPKFLNEYYTNSRLHYLSTWKAEFKSYVNELQSKGSSFPGRELLMEFVRKREITAGEAVLEMKLKDKRCVMHIDMDCFFVSVGLRKRPDLKGKPVAVTHSRGKGATIDPGADVNFEKREWSAKGEKGGKKKQNGNKSGTDNSSLDDFTFPDQSDSDNDVADDIIVTKPTKETFHSMAEIASCSYEARKAGVKNGMFMGQAKKLCPDLVTIPYDFDGYNCVSKILYDTMASFSHDIEAVSCDEMLVDCTDLLANTGATSLELASLLRQQIYDQTQCHASAGIASNILLAKMATRKAKPNGQYHLTSDMVPDLLQTQSIKNIPGVGWSLTKRLEKLKLLTCGDLQKVSMATLQKEFGTKTGQSLYRYCRGHDDRPIKIEQQRKSVSAEVNYGIRFTSDNEAVKFVEELSEEVCCRLKNINMKGKTVTLKLMIRRPDAPRNTSKFMGHGICNNFSKSITLPLATDDSRIVGKECVGILRNNRATAEDLRGIGIQIQRLESATVDQSNKLDKGQSILNFTVDRNIRKTDDSPCNVNNNIVNDHASTISVDNKVPYSSVSPSHTEMTAVSPTSNFNARNSDKKSHEESKEGNSSDEKENRFDMLSEGMNSSHVANNNYGGNNLYDDTEEVMDKINFDQSKSSKKSINDNFQSPSRIQNANSKLAQSEQSVQNSNLLEDLERRQGEAHMLPPLPCLPDIKTPDSGRKTAVPHPLTPVPAASREVIHVPVNQEDYFPSPSQIDNSVLMELPADIREQIQKEIDERKKNKSELVPHPSSVIRSPGAGCSHWQLQGDNSSRTDVQNEAEIEIEADSHSQDAIVPLPSPSQLDLNCLNALPECMQNELRAAYAKLNSNDRDQHKGDHPLMLQQAKSPSKSPNKKSPSKKSPHFKVPRGRPRGGGRKRGSSKKILFRDQTRQQKTSSDILEAAKNNDDLSVHIAHTNLKQSAITDIPDTHATTSYISDSLSTGNNKSTSSRNSENVDNQSTKNCDNSVYQSAEPCDKSVTGSRTVDQSDCVNLCGAVHLQEVKCLIKEWITSTPVPQSEDEDVLVQYLQELILDKNLEQVDLVLKFMYRNILRMDRGDWFSSLQKIYTMTQSVIQALYGSRLATLAL